MSTDASLNSKRIIEYYGRRWEIEVISYVYKKALSGGKLEELYEEFRVPA
ncbi:hypothetical protein GWI36_07125 [Psychrilyobacter sp. BL5]|nr:hypothetical protein [Psychrilyobacter piezotolerans]